MIASQASLGRTVNLRYAATLVLTFLAALLVVSGVVAASVPPELLGEDEDPKAEAADEAVGWPDYDSTAFADRVAKIEQARAEAADEAAGWPDYDSTAFADRVVVVTGDVPELVGSGVDRETVAHGDDDTETLAGDESNADQKSSTVSAMLRGSMSPVDTQES